MSNKEATVKSYGFFHSFGLEAKRGNCEKVMRCLGESLLGELRLGEAKYTPA